MKVLLLGSGGREHALAWKINESERLTTLYVAPGNAGTAGIAENVNIKVTDFEALATFVENNGIEMLVVGPEDPLVEGIRDYFEADARFAHLMIVGPGKAGAILEGRFRERIYDSSPYPDGGLLDRDERKYRGRD